ncbi:hypothetical protein C8R46DRAFT_1031810 [Mycena filopes]|nr:hypothetical protein C8R46DRAFT_1031810 [Mycena filopes]
MSDSELYSRLLFPKKQGYPLFHPQPFDDLPEAARRVGTEIGDVGLVTQDGSFDPIFNILRPPDHPAQRFGVPAAFEPVTLLPQDIAKRALFHLHGSDISNTAISKKRIDVEAGIEDNVQVSLWLRYWIMNLIIVQNWYAFVNGDLGRMVGNGELYLVTGVTKATSWSVAAIEDHSGEGKVALRLKAAQIGHADDPKAISIVDSNWSEMSTKGSFGFFNPQSPLSDRNTSALSRTSSGGTRSACSTSPSDDGNFFSSRFHPSDVINEYLLHCVEDAVAAVTHDDEWASVLTPEDDEVPDWPELLRRIVQNFETHTVGDLSLSTYQGEAANPDATNEHYSDWEYLFREPEEGEATALVHGKRAVIPSSSALDAIFETLEREFWLTLVACHSDLSSEDALAAFKPHVSALRKAIIRISHAEDGEPVDEDAPIDDSSPERSRQKAPIMVS